MEKIRLRTKIYSSDRLARSIKHIEVILKAINHDLTYDYNFFQRMYVRIFGQETLSLNMYKEIPVFSNFLGYSYLSEFFEINDFKHAKKSLLDNEDIGYFAQYSSNYILKVVTIVNNHLDQPLILDNGTTLDITLNDLGYSDHLLIPKEKQTFFASESIDLSVSIFLLDILCTINFARYLVPKMISRNSSLLFRIKFITYVSTVESIDKLSKGFNRQTGAEMYANEISCIVDKKRKIINQNIRNSLFHFNISEDDIPVNKLDSKRIFFSLIEHLSNMPFSQYDSIIESELEKLSNLINKWIF